MVSGHILGSYVTHVLHTARISNVKASCVVINVKMVHVNVKLGHIVSTCNCIQFVTSVGQR